MKFKDNWSNRPVAGKTHAGNRFEPTYKMSIDDDGVRDLAVVGQTDTYAYIQSFAQSTDINYILDRFARGDESALSKIQGVYGDFTNVPKTLAELSQRALDAENIFNALPLDTRAQFNFSPSEFFAKIGTPEFNEIMGIKSDVNEGLGVTEIEPVPAGESVNTVEGGVENE